MEPETTKQNSTRIVNKNKENLLNKKVKRNFHSDSNKGKNKNSKEENKQQTSKGIDKFTKIESLYNKARELYAVNVSILIIILTLF